MKLINTLFIISLPIFLVTGCTQFKKLIGIDDDKQHTINMNGIWVGEITLDGQTLHSYFEIIQKGDSITYGYNKGDISFFSINFGQFGHIPLSGKINGSTFSMSGTQTTCPKPWYFSGEIKDENMLVNITTEGNNVPDTYCYPNSIDQTLIFHR